MKYLMYTFRTFPWKDRLDKEVFVFGKLNKDFRDFLRLIEAEKPDYIVGVAKSRKSQLETKAINDFNGKKVVKGSENEYLLDSLEGIGINLAGKSSNSFCNWTMYKVKDYLIKNGLDVKLSFVHINEQDVGLLRHFMVSQ